MNMRYGLRTFGLEMVMVAAAVAFLFPVYALVTLSLKDQRQVAESPLAPPSSPALDNYSAAWTRAELGPALCAQCHGLQAELLARQGDLEASLHEYASCRQAWEDLGRREDAAEAALEAVLVAASYSGAPESGKAQFVPSLKLLTNLLEHGRRLLGVDEVNALLVLAEARIQYLSGDEEKAERTAQRARAWLTRPIGVSGHGGPRRSKRRYWKPQGNALRPLE